MRKEEEKLSKFLLLHPFSTVFENQVKSLILNSVTRHVNFHWTKLDRKCQRVAKCLAKYFWEKWDIFLIFKQCTLVAKQAKPSVMNKAKEVFKALFERSEGWSLKCSSHFCTFFNLAFSSDLHWGKLLLIYQTACFPPLRYKKLNALRRRRYWCYIDNYFR